LNQSRKTRVDPPQPGLGGAGLWVGMKPGGLMNHLGAVLDERLRSWPPGRPTPAQCQSGCGWGGL